MTYKSLISTISRIVIIGALIAIILPLLAAPTDLDPTWGGGDGIVEADFNPSPNNLNRVAALISHPDGRVTVVGENYVYPTYETTIAAARFLADGTPDLSFGTNGITLLPLKPGTTHNTANGAALQPDGKIVISSSFHYDDLNENSKGFGILRLNQDGNLDTSFGENGYFETNEPGIASPIIVQTDGKIVAGGSLYLDPEPSEDPFPEVYDALIIRLNTDGSLDSTFGDGGKSIWVEDDDQHPMNIVVQPDGKIVMQMFISIYSGQFTNGIVRFNADGTVDTSFGDNGEVHLTNLEDFENNFGFMSNNMTITVQADGKLVIGGYQRNPTTNPNQYRPVLTRLNLDGTPDDSFGTNGVVVTDLTPASALTSHIAIQPDGKILLGGDYFNNGPNFRVILRYHSNGELDTTWNETGYRVASQLGIIYGDDPFAVAPIALQANGKILTLYENYNYPAPDTGKFNIARFIGESSSNTAPELAIIGGKSIEAGQTLSFTTTATDTESNDLTFTLDDGDTGSVPTGAEITAGGEFSWTPSEAQVGQHTFDVVVTDDGEPNLSDSETITVTVTPAPVEPPTELLTNRGFENKTPSNPKRAAKWTVSNLVSADGRVCNKPNNTPPVTVAYVGKCAFQFQSSVAKARYIEQKITLSEALAHQTMRVAGYIKRKGLTAGAAIQVQITYADNSKATLKIVMPGGTKGYKPFENTLLLEKDAKKARVRIMTGKSKGRLLVDSLSLTVSDEAPLRVGDAPILLPTAHDLRGN